MTDPFQRVTAGEPVNIKADTWNAFSETAEAFLTGRIVQSFEQLAAAIPTIITCENKTALDLEEYSIAAISGLTFPPDESSEEELAIWQNGWSVEVDKPQADGLERLVILSSACLQDEYADGLLKGFTPVKVELSVDDSSLQYAIPIKDEVTKLEQSAAGPFRIVWQPAELGEKWCLVEVGAPFIVGKLRGDINADFAEGDPQFNVKNITMIMGTDPRTDRTDDQELVIINNDFGWKGTAGGIAEAEMWSDGKWRAVQVEC